MTKFNVTMDAAPPTKFDYKSEEYAYFGYTGSPMMDNNSLYVINDTMQYEFDVWKEVIKPNPKEWLVMVCYLIVFVMSLVGNGLIVTYVLRRKNLQTTVNFFMLNLALADTLVTVIALPSTVSVDIFETWSLGKAMCKLTPYLQMTVTSVSALSLGAIAINRWFVVCHPLKVSRIKNAKKSVAIGMAVIWIFSMATLCPVAFVNELVYDHDPEITPELKDLKSCVELWESPRKRAAFHLYYFIICYMVPLIVLAATYTMVFRELRKAEIPGHCTTVRYQRECHCDNAKEGKNKSINLVPKSPTSPKSPPTSPASPIYNGKNQRNLWRQTDGQLESSGSPYLPVNAEDQEPLNGTSEEKLRFKIRFTRRMHKSLSLLSFKNSTKDNTCRKCSAMMLLRRSRRRSATMQVVLIIVFGVCYAPAMVLDLTRHVFLYDPMHFGFREKTYFGFSVVHLIVYVNSAINPIIYNFFSSQFRKEFRKTFSCFFSRSLKRQISGISTSFFGSRGDQSRRETTQSTRRMSEC